MRTAIIHKHMDKWCVSCYENSGLSEFLETNKFEEATTLLSAWLDDGRRDVVHQLALDLQG